MTADRQFCLSCWQDLDFLGDPGCAGCGKPFSFERPIGSLCGSCLLSPPEHDGVRAVVAYDEKSSLLALQLKYGARLGHASLMAKNLARYLDGVPNDALIVPVPLHRWRLWSRGFNQSVLIGGELARHSGSKMELDVLYRKKSTPPLRGMGAKKRQKAVKNAFALRANSKTQIDGKTILLMDDVYTSGATANACAQILKKGGAEKVLVFCWARVLTEDERT